MLIILFAVPREGKCKTDPFCTGTNTAQKTLGRLKGSTALAHKIAGTARAGGRGCGARSRSGWAAAAAAGAAVPRPGGGRRWRPAATRCRRRRSDGARSRRRGPRAPLRTALLHAGPPGQNRTRHPPSPRGPGPGEKPRSPGAARLPAAPAAAASAGDTGAG